MEGRYCFCCWKGVLVEGASKVKIGVGIVANIVRAVDSERGMGVGFMTCLMPEGWRCRGCVLLTDVRREVKVGRVDCGGVERRARLASRN